ncbi:MAG: 30S ribosomal protein S8 [Candidatus Gracilibacteria bacterium]|nr:30S ribosomal protein S8 [Candidatus Gracilibacteria bacterium]
MTIDSIADLLTRLRNAYMGMLTSVSFPHSKMKEEVLRILKKNKYIVDYKVEEKDGNKKDIVVELNNLRVTKYVPTFTRISKPGQRIYVKSREIRKSRNGKGIYIVSTPKGLMTGYEARSLNLGGELICEVF